MNSQIVDQSLDESSVPFAVRLPELTAPDVGWTHSVLPRSNPQHIKPPRISVIIPVLNEEKLLERTLRVFSRQLRERFVIEIIISDGGSTDCTLALAEAALANGHADVLVCHTAAHRQTIAEGRNAGAEAAQGNVLIFLNGDTVPANIAAFLDAVQDWSCGSGGMNALACPVAIAPDERRWSDVVFHALMNSYVRLLNVLGAGMGRGECQIIDAEAFHAVGGYNTRIAAGEDFDLYRRLRQRGRIGWKPATLVYESPRRYRRFGYVRVAWMWAVNALSVVVRRKAVSEEWDAVR